MVNTNIYFNLIWFPLVHFIGQGQMATVEFVAVDGGTSEKEAGESCDVSAQKLIRFEDLNPFTYTQKSLILSNTTLVPYFSPVDFYVVSYVSFSESASGSTK